MRYALIGCGRISPNHIAAAKANGLEFVGLCDMGIALVKFKNGAYGIIEGTTNLYPKNLEETLYLFGEKGTVKCMTVRHMWMRKPEGGHWGLSLRYTNRPLRERQSSYH